MEREMLCSKLRSILVLVGMFTEAVVLAQQQQIALKKADIAILVDAAPITAEGERTSYFDDSRNRDGIVKVVNETMLALLLSRDFTVSVMILEQTTQPPKLILNFSDGVNVSTVPEKVFDSLRAIIVRELASWRDIVQQIVNPVLTSVRNCAGNRPTVPDLLIWIAPHDPKMDTYNWLKAWRDATNGPDIVIGMTNYRDPGGDIRMVHSANVDEEINATDIGAAFASTVAKLLNTCQSDVNFSQCYYTYRNNTRECVRDKIYTPQTPADINHRKYCRNGTTIIACSNEHTCETLCQGADQEYGSCNVSIGFCLSRPKKYTTKWFEHCPVNLHPCTSPLCAKETTRAHTTTNTTHAPTESVNATELITVMTTTSPVLEPWQIAAIALASAALFTTLIGLIVCCVCAGKENARVKTCPLKHIHPVYGTLGPSARLQPSGSGGYDRRSSARSITDYSRRRPGESLPRSE